MMQKILSHKTAIHRTRPSYTVRTIENSGLVKNKVFDFGCGVGGDVNYLKSKVYELSFWDPYFFPENPPSNHSPHSFETIFCTYILNVINKKERIQAIKEIQRLLAKSGCVFFTVRTSSDIQEKAKKNTWKKQFDGWITKRGTFQKGFNSSELENFLLNSGFKHVKTVNQNPLIVMGSNSLDQPL